MEYCNLSNAHAQQLRADEARDFLELSKALVEFHSGKLGPNDLARLDTAKVELIDIAEKMFGANTFDEEYTKILKAAEEIGCGQRYRLFEIFQNYYRTLQFPGTS